MKRRTATWYFDFISPFAYLQFGRFPELADELEIVFRPVVFTALLQRHGHKGPAEIPSKRLFVYRFFKWQADRRGLPFRMPPAHPFNPLPALRLAVLAVPRLATVRTIFDFIYGEGRTVEGRAAITELGARLGLDDAFHRISEPAVKARLRANTDEALADQVFGVPSFVVDGELFWGDDSTDMLLDWLSDGDLFRQEELVRLANLPMGVKRQGM